MKKITKYNIYIFISTFTRNIIDVYSIIYLYQKDFTIQTIIAIYSLIYLFGFFISSFSIKIGNKIGYKYILILSSILTSIAFYIINISTNVYLISLILSLSIFTYHPIRHYYGLTLLKQKKEIGNSLIFIYLSQLISSYIAIKNIKPIYLIIIAIIGIIPAFFITKEPSKKITYQNIISKQKIRFFIFDQFKIIFLLLEPLYLYLISKNISYVGIFNIIITIASIICIYLFTNKINIDNKYKYLNILFTMILFLKININNKIILLFLAFFEGVGIKTNELISTMNLYNIDNFNEGYIITAEKIFCITRTLILSIIYFLMIDLKTILYILLVGVFILSFQYNNKKDTI